MKTSKTMPEWAVQLVNLVCKDYKRALPRQTQWRQSRCHVKSSGYAGFGKIHVTAGSDEQDARLVLLHELSHHITQKRQKQKSRYAFRTRYKRVFEGHSTRFWKLAFELYERYGIGLEYAYEREKGYKKTAVKVYNQIASK